MGKIGSPLGVPLSRQVDFGSVLSMAWYQGQTQDAVVKSGTSVRQIYTATASATPHTVGSYAEIVSALSQDISGIFVQITTATNVSAADTSSLINIAIGGAGGEVVVVPNIAVGYKVFTNYTGLFIPIKISKGTRVAFNAQSVIGSKTIACRFIFVYSRRKMPAAPTQIDTYGADTTKSAGVTISNPGAGNTKGSYTEITASTNRPLQGLFISIQGAQSTAISSGSALVDIAIGSAGNEVNIMEDLHCATTTGETVDPITPSTVLWHIPAGTRISARYQRSTTISLDVIVHGIPY